MEAVLKAEGIAKSYEGRRVLSDINVTLGKGETVCLLGVSGIGKTTLFNILSGLEAPDSGRVLLGGEDVTGKSGLVGYMQQSDLLLPYRTIAENAALPLILRGEKKRDAVKKASAMLADFGLEGCEKLYPAQLSGGMRQRAALLRSCLFSSTALLMDEPFSALDAITRAGMQKWFKRVAREQGLSVFLITHDINEALLLSDRIYILAGSPGKIICELPNSLPEGENPELTREFLESKIKITELVAGGGQQPNGKD